MEHTIIWHLLTMIKFIYLLLIIIHTTNNDKLLGSYQDEFCNMRHSRTNLPKFNLKPNRLLSHNRLLIMRDSNQLICV